MSEQWFPACPLRHRSSVAPALIKRSVNFPSFGGARGLVTPAPDINLPEG